MYQNFNLDKLDTATREEVDNLFFEIFLLMRSMSTAYSVESFKNAHSISKPIMIGDFTWLFHEYATMETLRTQFKPIKTCDVCRFSTRNKVNIRLKLIIELIKNTIMNDYPETELFSYDEVVDAYEKENPTKEFHNLDITILWRAIYIQYLYTTLYRLDEEMEARL